MKFATSDIVINVQQNQKIKRHDFDFTHHLATYILYFTFHSGLKCDKKKSIFREVTLFAPNVPNRANICLHIIYCTIFFYFQPTVHLLLYVVLLVVKKFFKEILYSLWSNIRKFLCNSIPNIKSMQLRSLMRKKWSCLFGEATSDVHTYFITLSFCVWSFKVGPKIIAWQLV